MRVFLSYSTPDHETADRIRHALAQQRPGMDIYFAPLRNDAGAYWIARLDDELAQADAVLLLLGHRVGPWQELEYFEALRHHRLAGRPLIVPLVLVDSAPALPFLEQLHRLSVDNHAFDEVIALALQALDGADMVETTPQWRLVNPYRGLLAMETQDAAFFFGRETLTGEILDRLARQDDRVHTLVGNSGVGKSSVAMAGVLSALHSRLWPGQHDAPWPDSLAHSHTWPTVMLRPGENPVKALAQACARLWLQSPAEIEAEALKWRKLLMGDSSLSALIAALLDQVAERAGAEAPDRVIVYLDQAEELYSRADQAEAHRFSELLAEAVADPQLLVMLSLRSDYYGRLQGDAKLFKAATTVDVTPMDRNAIERVIRLPAERLGVRFEPPEMVTHIADAATREPGSMPMLSDLLADAWRDMAEDRQSAGLLHFPADIVDISRPLADKAERFLTRHHEDEATLRRLFTLKLALVPKEGDIVRRRARREECSDAEWQLIEVMAERDWRLLTTGEDGGEPVAEVAHEALLRHWPRAARWLDDSREFLIWKGQFESEFRAWEDAAESDRDRALLTGLRLDAATRWRRERGADLGAAERSFIAASEQVAADALVRDRRLRTRILRLSVSALVVVAIVAATALWQWHKASKAEQVARSQEQIALGNEREAIRARDEAQRQARLADARRLAMAAESVLDDNAGETSLAGLLATESLKRSPTPEGKDVLRRVLSLIPESEPLETPWPWSGMHYSPDGRLVAYTRRSGSGGGPASGQVAVIDTHAWQRRALHDFEGRVWPRLSVDGRWMTVAGYGRRLRIFDNPAQRTVLDVRQDRMFDAAFHPDGQTLYVARTDGVIEVRKAPTWQVAHTLTYPLDAPRRWQVAIAVDPSGQQLLVYGQRGRGKPLNPWLIPITGGEPLPLGAKATRLGAFTPDGDRIVTANWDEEVNVWDARTGEPTQTLSFGADVSALAITPDGASVFVATQTGKVFLHGLVSGELQGEFHHPAWVNAVAISADGELLATASDDGTAVVWGRHTGTKRLSIRYEDEVWAVTFGGEQTLLTGGKDGWLRAIDIATGKDLHRFQFSGGVRGIDLDPATGVLALDVRGTDDDQSWTDLVVVDRRSGEEISRIEHNGTFAKLAFSPDGDAIATATVRTGALKIWDTATGNLRIDPGITAATVSFSRDGRRVIAGGGYEEVAIIDAQDGRRIGTLGEPGGVEAVQIPADGQTAVTYGQDNTFRAWDLDTGEALWSHPADRPDTHFVKLSGDGRRFADLSQDRKTIEVGETRTGRIIGSVPVGDRASYALSEDGAHLLVTRTGISDPADPERPYSTVELWSVDSEERVFARHLKYGIVKTAPLEGDRVMLLAEQYRNGEDSGFVEVFDVKNRKVLWSIEISPGPATALRDLGRGGTLAVSQSGTTQLRDLGTGRLLFEVAGVPSGVMVTLPDRGIVVSANARVIEARDLQNGEVRHRIEGFDGFKKDIRLSADRDRLFVAVNGDAHTGVGVWRTTDWSLERFIAMDSRLRSIHPLSDPSLIAVYDNADTLRIWRISTGEEVRRFAHTKTASGVVAAENADRAVTWREGSLRVWNTQDGTEVAHRLSHGGVTRLAFSPDGRIVAYLPDRPRTSRRGDAYESLVIWEPDSKDDPVVLPLASPRALRFDPSGRFLAVRLGDETMRLFDVATLRVTATLNALPGATVSKMAFSGDGALLYVEEEKDRKYALRIFRTGSGTEIARVDQGPTHLPMPESPRVAVRDRAGQWRFWDVATAMPDELLWAIESSKLDYRYRARRYVAERGLPLPEDLPEVLNDLVIPSPQLDGPPFYPWAIDTGGRRIAGMRDGDAVVISLDDARELARWPDLELQGSGLSVGQHYRPVRGMLFADRGSSLLAYDTAKHGTADMHSRLWLWRWQGEEPRLLSERNPINMVAVSPTGDLFASAEGNTYQDRRSDSWVKVGTSQVRIWDARTGEAIGRIPMEDNVDTVAFSPTGDRLVARTFKDVVVFEVIGQKEIARFEFTGQRTLSGSVAFTPDGRHILAEAADGVQMWPVEGTTDRLFRHGSDWPRYQPSDDGRFLATWGRTLLRVWDLETGAGLFELAFPRLKYRNFLFSGSNNDLIAKTDTGLVRIPWRADHLIDEACRRIVRNIEDTEWRRFFDDEPLTKICSRPTIAEPESIRD